ncbi:MAG: NAD(P)H-dependent oxidoreductase, partial [Acidobacteriota bacterium]|nr:NAD(P)H-dependent oxidoreductase [Acidobacteriota bacterium]
IKILGVRGSMRVKSYSAIAADAVLEAARGHGAETRLLDLRRARLPMYDPDAVASNHEGVREATEAVNWADAFLLTTPDYHGSVSGALKNFLDFYWEEFAGKLFGYVCASHEKGLTAMEQMRTSVRQCYGWSLPYGVSIHGEKDLNASGEIVNAQVERRLLMLARDLVVYGSLIRSQFQADLASGTTETFAARYAALP